jgi:anti-sigma regulatory factor (Ser/Thr protein kinase)
MIELPLAASSAGRARRVAADFATGSMVASLLDDLVLVVSELVANGVAHGRLELELTLSAEDGTILVQVRDDGDGTPRMLHVDPLSRTGRGLCIVDAVSTRWGCRPVPHRPGKTVWAELTA